VDRPWLNPHEEILDRAFNEEHQARCYKIVFDAIQDQDWIKGIYWWKWPTTLQNISAEDRRFVPYDKTAERVIDEWFEKYSSY
ncbi:MAG: glycoside hydrolase family 113, partial [Cyclobacteriaceae bacterium]